jgi:adenosylhomocysteine nucleosidase
MKTKDKTLNETLGIIGAMEIEVNALTEIMTEVKEIEIAKTIFRSGKINNKNVVVVCSGIGKVNAAIAASLLVERFKVSKILNIGVAGGIKNGIKLGDIVLSKNAIQHDVSLDACDKLRRGKVHKIDKREIDCDLSLCKQLSKIIDKLNYSHYIGTIVSGDEFISDTKFADFLRNEFNAFAVDMETAAIAQVTYFFEVPFVAIRSISDNADDNADNDFETNCKKAAEKAINIIKVFCK